MSGLRFRVEPGVPFEGLPVYRRFEYSFDFEPDSREQLRDLSFESGVTSIAIGRLQIEVNVRDGRALHVWGLHPAKNWRAHPLFLSKLHPGAVLVADDRELKSGVSIGLAEVGEWVTAYDQSTGWVRATPDLETTDEQVVLIGSGTCLGLIGEQLNSIWVRPTFEP